MILDTKAIYSYNGQFNFSQVYGRYDIGFWITLEYGYKLNAS